MKEPVPFKRDPLLYWVLGGAVSVALIRAVVSVAVFFTMRAPYPEASEVLFLFGLDLPTNITCGVLALLTHQTERTLMSPLEPFYFITGECVWGVIGGLFGAFIRRFR